MLWGVGPVTLEKLHRLALRTVGDVAACDRRVLTAALGAGLAEHLCDLSHAIDDRAVEPDRETKSIGSEETFAHDVSSPSELRRHLLRMADTVARRCRDQGLAARTVTLKIRYGDFSTVTRSHTLAEPIDTSQAMIAEIDHLLADIDIARGVRLAGVSARNFAAPETQMQLFDGDERQTKNANWGIASRAMDRIRRRFGDDAISTGPDDETQSTPWGPRRE
jgi:DNA polymerase-4